MAFFDFPAKLFAFLLAFSSLVFFGGLPALAACAAFGFFLPGFLLLRALKFSGTLVETIALSVLGSVLLSSHAVYWASIVFGYGAFAFFAAFAAISALAFFADAGVFRLPKISQGEGPALAFGAAVFLVLFGVFLQTLWVPTDSGIRVGGWNWSDLFAHLPIIQTVNNGNFPPQTPFFAGAPLVYHWFADLHTAFISKATGMLAVDFIRFENALYSALFALLVFSLSLVFFKNWKPALLAAALVFFGGSFAYANLFSDFAEGKGNLLELVTQNPYDNDWKYFQVPSVLGGYMIVQRPQMVGLPGLAAVVLLLAHAFHTAGKFRRKSFFAAGLFAGMLAPFQFYGFASAILVAGIFFASELAKGGLSRKEFAGKLAQLAPFAFAFIVPALLVAAPFVYSAVSTTTSAGNVQIKLGWLALEQGQLPQLRALLPQELSFVAVPFEFALFYAANFGMAFLLAVASFFSTRLVLGEKWFLAAWAWAMFLVANVFSLSGTHWDMAKFFAYMMVPLGILAAGFVFRVWEKGMKLAASFFVFASVLTPVLLLAWTAQSEWQAFSWEEAEAGAWIGENTPQGAVFAAYFGHISPVDALAGRFRISGYSSWMANYGLPAYQEREGDLKAIFCSNATSAVPMMEKYGARFVYLGLEEREKFSECAFDFAESPLFAQRFANGAAQVYELKQ